MHRRTVYFTMCAAFCSYYICVCGVCFTGFLRRRVVSEVKEFRVGNGVSRRTQK